MTTKKSAGNMVRRYSADLFPAPGPHPKFREPANDCERAAMQDELNEWVMQGLIHRAVHTNDPELRGELAGTVRRNLLQGYELTSHERKWLVWILSVLEDHDAIPKLAIGNAIKTRERVAKIRALVELRVQRPKAGVVELCQDFAARFDISYSAATKLYYDEAFTLWLMMAKKIPKNKGSVK